MQDKGEHRVMFRQKPNRKVGNRKKRAPKDNDHIASMLEDYSEMTTEAFKKK
jgi:hypothetical protein